MPHTASRDVSEKSLFFCDAVGILLLAPRAKVSKASNMLRHAVRTKNTWWGIPTAVQSFIPMQHQRRLLLNAGFNQWPLILAKSQINDQSLLRDANSSKSWRVADVSKVVSGRRLVYSAAVGTLLLPFRARLIKASNIFPRAGRSKPLLMGHSYPSPICINSNAAPKTNVIQCMCRPMTSMRQDFSAQFPPLQKHTKTQINERSFCATVFATEWILTDASRKILVGDAALWRLPGILLLAGISLLVLVRIKHQETIKHVLPYEKTITNPSGIFCQICALVCSNVVRINPQLRRQLTNACVNQWPPWDKISLYSSHPYKNSDQWAQLLRNSDVCDKMDFDRFLRQPCVRKIFGWWCCPLTSSRNPVSSRNPIACSGSNQASGKHQACFAIWKNNHSP